VGGNDPDNRRVMRFKDLSLEEGNTLSWTSEWIKLRRSRMSFMYGSCNIEAISHTLLKITREYLGEESVVYINKSKESVDVSADGKSIFAGKAEVLKNGMILIPSQSAICLGD
jgi:cyclomaltodextrinase